MSGRRITVRSAVLAVFVAALAEPVAAHAGALSGEIASVPVPTWLTIVTGGSVVGASFLFTSLMTDHGAMRSINGWRLAFPTPSTVREAGTWSLRVLSAGVLVLVVYVGFVGPREPEANFGMLFVWAGWWAGYTMSIYLVANTWPVVNPWRAVATALPRVGDWSYPERLGSWPAVAGLLVMVYVEVVSPVAANPRVLSWAIVVYTVVTLAGAAVFGSDAWFEYVDPITSIFRAYGRIAPFQRTETGFEFRLPSTAATEQGPLGDQSETAFIVAVLWATTYDGLVSTPTWNAVVTPVVEAGVPALPIYLVLIVVGFFVFYAVYKAAARYSRETADTYVTTDFIQRWFAPSLLPIAAGYHVAHFLGYFVTLSPTLSAAVVSPIQGPSVVSVLALPGWFGGVQLAFVLVGHLLAIWVAHALAFELFPGRLQPIRSQYPFIGVMILYTMASMWVVAQPFANPAYI